MTDYTNFPNGITLENGVHVTAVEELTPQAAPAAPDAITATDAPAGGTGATAGAYDTAAHRDEAIAAINALIDDVTALRSTVDSLITALTASGILE